LGTSIKCLSAVGVGAPIVALFIGAPTALAATGDSSPATGTLSTQQTPDLGVAVSAGGHDLLTTANSTATTTGPSLAIAFNNSTATANGTGNIVLAGNNGTASATGDFNNVAAFNNGIAQVNGGSRNNVLAVGDSSTAVVNGGSNNVVAELCGGSKVTAQSDQILTSSPCLE
jgi:hypothetical protein